ncbi:PAPA-1-like conserved region-domain-containing protein [Phialemonium atrogriseum]|uniref:PAPA-1-like conserved region-domain-containing protein n=1 Tax=Phialemonium atrogriseum TaxID=1093897 RepID=A0AAJ0CCW7_9PEZI|nr:PAPA-1-like conserved region-domain-containing protein [Phialemonium atrogriseum]KAK1772909.1 PAPA-1-like conserved region-domain-containing protein [Phialemonium atrogriseum]
MSSRPRRSAAQRATEAITDMADRDNERTMSSRSRRSTDGRGVASVSRHAPSSSPASSLADSDQHMHLTVKLPSSKLRQATTANKRGASSIAVGRREQFVGDEIVAAKRSTRGGKKSYVVESESDDDEEEEEGEDEIQVGNLGGQDDDDDEDEEEEEEEEEEDEDEEMEDLGEEDADGEEVDEENMDVDAQGDDDDLGDEDAEGDVDMDVAPLPPPPTIKISKPARGGAPSAKARNARLPKSSIRASGASAQKSSSRVNEDEDEELSDLESEPEEEINDTVEVGGERPAEDEDEDPDAEGEEIEVADEDAEEDAEADEEEEEEALDSDGETPAGGSRAETPDLSRMTARQRAKHGDVAQEYMKLSDEVQAKKVFTAEELSMRRAEMARRRRNLSEKRNEEVKMETINKLLKKQAPKTNRRTALLPGDETPDNEGPKANPAFIRWVSTKDGIRVALPEEMLAGPAGRVFGGGHGLGGEKMVEEVS